MNAKATGNGARKTTAMRMLVQAVGRFDGMRG